MNEPVMPWHRQPREPAKAWAGFEIFLSMPPYERSYPKVAEHLGRWVSQIKAWGSKYNWQERARLRDQYFAKTADQVVIAATEHFQEQVIQDEVEDYIRQRNMWSHVAADIEKRLMNGEPVNSLELSRLANARELLDRQARRAARLPLTYGGDDSGGKADTANENWLLTLEGGAKRLQLEDGDDASSFTEFVDVATGDTGSSGEVQSSVDWEAGGEEPSGEDYSPCSGD
jgi:hypothetical protein